MNDWDDWDDRDDRDDQYIPDPRDHARDCWEWYHRMVASLKTDPEERRQRLADAGLTDEDD